ncbi:MAG: NrfD/PsrC family molybdoenzyme membrane anchor subunit [Gemmatimonadota bacterium]
MDYLLFDPNYVLPNEHIRWGLVVVVYMFLSGVGAGSLIIAVLPWLRGVFDRPALREVRRMAVITAAACFTVIPLAVTADVGQPLRMWRVVLAPHLTSAMPYGSVVLMVLTALIFGVLWLVHRPYLAEASEHRTDWLGRVYGLAARGYTPQRSAWLDRPEVRFWVALTAVVMAVLFVFYTGFLLSTMRSFGLWYTPLLGVFFGFAALTSGFAWMSVVSGISGSLREETAMVRLITGSAAVFLATHLTLRLWDLAHGAYVESFVWPAVRTLHFDLFAGTFVGGELVVGGALALALLVAAAVRGSALLGVAGGLLTLVGMFLSRWNLIIGGQSISRTGEGFIFEPLHWLGREGVFAASGLVIWAFVVGFFLWFALPWNRRGATTPGSEGSGLADSGLNRRRLMGLTAGAGLAAVSGYATLHAVFRPFYRKRVPGPTPPQADAVVHSVCLSCDARCGNRVVIRDGRVRNLFGNPYHPASTMNNPVSYETPMDASLRTSGSLCLKGVSGLQYLYDPYRIRRPLKRTGPRGSGQFKPISWEQLLEEVVEGGRLFEEAGEDREVDGLRAVRNFDPIDPSQPELGPQAYGLVWNTGRGQPGRQNFVERFMDAFGSANYVSHTDLCQMNWYVANYLLTGRYLDGEVRPSSQLFGDINHSTYLLFFGVNLGGGWKPGVNTSAPILANRHANKECKLVLIDPYVPHGRHYADEWVPIQPGADAALALGMIRWIFENERFDRDYITRPSRAAAEAAGHPTFTNGTHLVVMEEGHPDLHRMLRRGGEPLVMTSTGAVPFQSAREAEPFVDAVVDGVRVKSAWQILRDDAFSRSLEDWAEICGIPTHTVVRLAREFTSHGRTATASCYRGATMHSNGVYSGLAIQMLNALIGNYGWKGGVITGAGAPGWQSGLFNLNQVAEAPRTQGAHVSRISSRSTVRYEDTTEFRRKVEAGEDPYPSQRPWYPFTHAGITTEAAAAFSSGYPYRPKILINYYINSIKSIPGGNRYIETLMDAHQVPLFISIDTTVSETSIYSDYIVPDAMYLDGQYGFMGQMVGACPAPHIGIRTPAVEPLTDRTPDGRPMLLETFLIDVAQRLGMPGYGLEAIPGPDGQRLPLQKMEDYYVRALANLAANTNVPEAAPEEVAYVEKSYPVAKHRDLLPPALWRQVCTLLARGGYFESPDNAWDESGRFKQGMGMSDTVGIQIWHEVLATTRQPGTGRMNHGGATYLPAVDGRGRRIEDVDADYPFRVVTFRLATRTKARTAYDYWAGEIHPLNFIEVNPLDAVDLDIQDGDRVRISSPSGSAEGFARRSPRCRRGVIAGTHHFKHTQQGNSRLQIQDSASVMTGGTFVSPILHGMDRPIAEGNTVHPDPRRFSRGFSVNDAMRRNDEELGGMPLVDPAGGATVFLDTRVRIEKVVAER